MSRKMFRSFNLYLVFFLFLSFGCTPTGKTPAEKNSESIAALQKTLAQQEVILKRLQSLTADQLLRSNDLEQSIPPQDLLESLQHGFVELRKKTRALEKQIAKLEKDVKAVKSKVKKISKQKPNQKLSENVRKQEKIILGLISLQAGNPDKAAKDLQDILKQKNKTQLKAQIMMAIGNGFLAQGHAKQAVSYFGIILREYPESTHVPRALYFLGESMEEMAEYEKQKILWKELINNYPNSPLAKRAKKRLSDSGTP